MRKMTYERYTLKIFGRPNALPRIILTSSGDERLERMMVRIIVGDALEALRGLPDGSVHCCVTSPPYWGLQLATRAIPA